MIHMEPWQRVHDVLTQQEWDATQPKPAETFYERWRAASERVVMFESEILEETDQ